MAANYGVVCIMEVNTRFFLLNALLLPLLFFLQVAAMTEVLSGESFFLCLHVIFGIYTAECIYEVCCLEKTGIFSYAAIFLVCQFIGQVFIGNFSYFFGSEEHNDWIYMNKSMWLCFLSVFGLTAACHVRSFSQWGRRLSEHFFPDIHVEKLYMGRCIGMFLFSFSLIIFMMMAGLTGYADAEGLAQANSYVSVIQYLMYLAAGASLVLYLIFYEYLLHPTMTKRVLFLVLFILQFGVAVTSGMKKDTLVMFVCLFLIYYLVKRKVSIVFLLIAVMAVFGLYQFIDAYRTALRLATFSGSRLDTFLSVMSGLGADQGLYSDRLGVGEVADKFFSRLSLTDSLSLIVEYKDSVGLGPEDPTFLVDWLVTPFTIFLPRFLFPFKSMGTYGLWVTHTVMGLPDTVVSSSYVTVGGFLYLAGGAIMVTAGFFVIGAVFDFFGSFCRLEERNPIFIIVFFLVVVRIIEPSTPIDVVTDVVRATIIFTLMGMFLIRMKQKTDKRST